MLESRVPRRAPRACQIACSARRRASWRSRRRPAVAATPFPPESPFCNLPTSHHPCSKCACVLTRAAPAHNAAHDAMRWTRNDASLVRIRERRSAPPHDAAFIMSCVHLQQQVQLNVTPRCCSCLSIGTKIHQLLSRSRGSRCKPVAHFRVAHGQTSSFHNPRQK